MRGEVLWQYLLWSCNCVIADAIIWFLMSGTLTTHQRDSASQLPAVLKYIAARMLYPIAPKCTDTVRQMNYVESLRDYVAEAENIGPKYSTIPSM